MSLNPTATPMPLIPPLLHPTDKNNHTASSHGTNNGIELLHPADDNNIIAFSHGVNDDLECANSFDQNNHNFTNMCSLRNSSNVIGCATFHKVMTFFQTIKVMMKMI